MDIGSKGEDDRNGRVDVDETIDDSIDNISNGSTGFSPTISQECTVAKREESALVEEENIENCVVAGHAAANEHQLNSRNCQETTIKEVMLVKSHFHRAHRSFPCH